MIKKPVNHFLQDCASASIRFLQTSIVINSAKRQRMGFRLTVEDINSWSEGNMFSTRVAFDGIADKNKTFLEIYCYTAND